MYQYQSRPEVLLPDSIGRRNYRAKASPLTKQDGQEVMTRRTAESLPSKGMDWACLAHQGPRCHDGMETAVDQCGHIVQDPR